jgi:organic hydroperoxide reductase OsmC/OhrA
VAGQVRRRHSVLHPQNGRTFKPRGEHVNAASEAAIDPEEMLVAALCHMLSFLHVARLAGFVAASSRIVSASESIPR